MTEPFAERFAPPLRQVPDTPHRERVRVLLDHGADVQRRRREYVFQRSHPTAPGTTALHAAARRGDAPMVQLLLQHGATRDVRDAHGHTALDLAREAHAEAVIRLLE